MLINSPPPPPPSIPPKPPPPFCIIRLIIGPMVCIIMPNRRLPILAFIMLSIGAIWVIMSSPPPPPPNWALAGTVERVNSSSSVAAQHASLSARVMVLLLACASSAEAVQTGRTRRGYEERATSSVSKITFEEQRRGDYATRRAENSTLRRQLAPSSSEISPVQRNELVVISKKLHRINFPSGRFPS